jgi:hypothetical protein
MKPKCSFYQGTCSNPSDDCPFIVWHYQKKECRKGGLLITPNKLKYMETKK